MRKIMRNIRQILVMLLAVAVLFTDNSMMALASDFSFYREETGTAEETESSLAAEEIGFCAGNPSEDSLSLDGQISETDTGNTVSDTGSSAISSNGTTENTMLSSSAGFAADTSETENRDSAVDIAATENSGSAVDTATTENSASTVDTAATENSGASVDTVLENSDKFADMDAGFTDLQEDTASENENSTRDSLQEETQDVSQEEAAQTEDVDPQEEMLQPSVNEAAMNLVDASLVQSASQEGEVTASIGSCVNVGVSAVRLKNVTLSLGDGFKTAMYFYNQGTDDVKGVYCISPNNTSSEYYYVEMYKGDTLLGTTEVIRQNGSFDSFTAYPQADTLKAYVFVYDTRKTFAEENVNRYEIGTFSRTPIDTSAMSAKASLVETLPGGFRLSIELSGFQQDKAAVQCLAVKSTTSDWDKKCVISKSGVYEINLGEMDEEYRVKIAKILESISTLEYGTVQSILFEEEVGTFRTGADEEVNMASTFPDAVLRSYIYNQLGKEVKDTVLLSELYQKITTLEYSVTENPIRSLAGIELLGGLKAIDLSGQKISDVSTIDFSKLQHLTKINIKESQLTSFPDLSGTNVQYYDFTYNYIADTKAEIKKKLPPNALQEFDFDKFAPYQVRGSIAIVLADTYYRGYFKDTNNVIRSPLYVKLENLPVWEQTYTVKYSFDGGTEKTMTDASGDDSSYTTRLFVDPSCGASTGDQKTVTVTVYDKSGSVVLTETKEINFKTGGYYWDTVTCEASAAVDEIYYIYAYGDSLNGNSKDYIENVVLTDALGNVYATLGGIEYLQSAFDEGRYPDSFMYISDTTVKLGGFSKWNRCYRYIFKMRWNRSKLYGGSYNLVIKFNNGAEDIVQKNVFIVTDESLPSIESVSLDKFDEDGNPCFNIAGTKLIDSSGNPQFHMSLTAEDGSTVSKMLETKIVSSASSSHYLSVKMSLEDWQTRPEFVTLEISSLDDESIIYSEVFDFPLSDEGVQYGGYFNAVNGSYVCYFVNCLEDGTELAADFTLSNGTYLAGSKAEVSEGKAVFIPQVDGKQVNLLTLMAEPAEVCIRVYQPDSKETLYEGEFYFDAKQMPVDVYIASDDAILATQKSLSVSYVDQLAGSKLTYEVRLLDASGKEMATGTLKQRDGDRVSGTLELPGTLSGGDYQLQVSYEGTTLAAKTVRAYPSSPFGILSEETKITEKNGLVYWTIQSNLPLNTYVYIDVTTLDGSTISYHAKVVSVNGLTTTLRFTSCYISVFTENAYYLKIKYTTDPVSLLDMAQAYYTDDYGTLVQFQDSVIEESGTLSFSYTKLDQYQRISGLSSPVSVLTPLTVYIYEHGGYNVVREFKVAENNYLFTKEDFGDLDILENYYDIVVYSSDGTCVGASDILLAYDGMETVKESGDCLKLYPIRLVAGEGGTIERYGVSCQENATAVEEIYAAGTAIYDIKPLQGYKIKDVILDGVSIGAYEQVLLENVLASHQIIALFTEETGDEESVEKKYDRNGNEKNRKKDKGTAYPVYGSTEDVEDEEDDEEEDGVCLINVEIHGKGTVSVEPVLSSKNGSYKVEKGKTVTLTFEPEEGAKFYQAKIDDSLYLGSTYILKEISKSYNVEVFFSEDETNTGNNSGDENTEAGSESTGSDSSGGSTGGSSGSGNSGSDTSGGSTGGSTGSESSGSDTSGDNSGGSSGSESSGSDTSGGSSSESTGSESTGSDTSGGSTGGSTGSESSGSDTSGDNSGGSSGSSGNTGDSTETGNTGDTAGTGSSSGNTGDSAGSGNTGNVDDSSGNDAKNPEDSQDSGAETDRTFCITVKVTNGTAAGKPEALSSNKVTVAEGSSQTIYFSADLENYVLKTLKVDGETVTPAESYEFKDITADHTVEAVFDQQKVTVLFEDGQGNTESLELAVGMSFGQLPLPASEELCIFDGWYRKNGEKITSDSIVEAGDSVLTARYQPITIVTKQKIDVSSYFASELEEYLEETEAPKYKYIVHTLDSADGKLQPNTAKSDNKLGTVAVKTGIFTAKSAGKACIVLATYDEGEREYVESENELIINVVKPVAKKQTLTYTGQSLDASDYLEYQYADIAGYEPNFATVVFQSSKSSVVKVDSKTGKITAVRTGSAKITMTLTTELGNGKQSVVKTTVSVTVKIPTFKKAEVVLKEGKLKKISLSGLLKGLPVSWESSDETVATVDQNGKVKALSAGKSTITATVTSQDGTKTPYSYDVYVD